MVDEQRTVPVPLCRSVLRFTETDHPWAASAVEAARGLLATALG